MTAATWPRSATVADWVGAVLTGGASTRMGRDKAAIEIDGRSMADRVADALRSAGAAEVVTVGGPRGTVADDEPGEGPLAGIVTALRWAAGRVVVVAPCDLVAPEPGALRALAAAVADGAVAAVPAPDRPLPIALGDGAALAAAFAAGERAVHRALAGIDGVVVVPLAAAATADADTADQLPPDAR